MSSLASALNWNFHGFNPIEETWDAFEQRFTAFARFNQVEDESRKSLQLLNALSPEQFGKISASCVPKNPIDLSFEELLQHLRKIFKVKKCLAAEQVNFFLTRQGEDQSYLDFLNELKEKARSCEFEQFQTVDRRSWLNQALFIAFVMGIGDVDLRRKLLTNNGEMDVERALGIAQTCEVIDDQEEEERGKKKQRKRRSSPSTDSEEEEEECSSCGRDNHKSRNCWFKAHVCEKCGIRGHIGNACKNKNKKKAVKRGRKFF